MNDHVNPIFSGILNPFAEGQKVISKPGIYRMGNAEYQADPCPEPSLSSGTIKRMVSQSPLHARAAHPRLNPEREPEEAANLDFGSAAHDYLFQGGEHIEILEFDDYRKKDAQAVRDCARANGRIPVLAKHYDDIEAMGNEARRALAQSPDLQVDLASGKAEQSLFWLEDDVWCRARLDWFTSQAINLIIDYKTTSGTASPHSLSRTAAAMGWDVQAAFYLLAYRRLVDPLKPAKFVYMVQEKEPPHAVSFCGIEGTLLALGEDKVQHAIKQWRRCLKSDFWPGYPGRIVYPEPPAYAMIEWEENALCRPMGD